MSNNRVGANDLITRKELHKELQRVLTEYTQETGARLIAVVQQYDETHARPLRDWAALPWWRRLFTKPEVP